MLQVRCQHHVSSFTNALAGEAPWHPMAPPDPHVPLSPLHLPQATLSALESWRDPRASPGLGRAGGVPPEQGQRGLLGWKERAKPL